MFMCRCPWVWLVFYTLSGRKAWSRTMGWAVPAVRLLSCPLPWN